MTPKNFACMRFNIANLMLTSTLFHYGYRLWLPAFFRVATIKPDMKRTMLLSIVTLFSGTSLCQEITSNKKVTTITPVSTANINLTFFYSDQFNDTDGPFTISNGQTKRKLSLAKPALLFNAATGIPFYILPGEELQITSTNGEIHLTGPSKERTNELAFFLEFDKNYPEYFKTNAAISLGKRLYAVTYPAAEKFENHKKAKGLSFLEQYRKNHPVTEAFYEYAKQFFHYLRLANLFSILSSATTQIKNPPAFNANKDVLLNKDYQCDSCVDNTIYRMSAYAYRQYLVKKLKTQSATYLENTFNVTDSYFKGITKEFLLFITLKEQLGKGLKYDDPYYLKYLNSQNNNNNAYVEYLKQEIAMKNLTSTKNELVSFHNTTTNWDALIAKHRGKMIYIDIWASWCLPCRKELPNTKKLGQSYKPEQLSIIYISADQKYSAWQNAAKSEDINTGNSFIINDFKNSELNKKFKIGSLPRYLLFDRNGNVIDEHAPVPSSAELKKMIDKYLGTPK
ncbi:MAG: TlpA family protein disulfide reductase [Candidatus Kuenenia stuttgartiensis]|nr:TlpA family protein disulfide reductase [Candidatus Kuenenia stuttgartiensis]